jgi:glycerophosphoryl diester phosphodiesterase
VLIYGHGTDDPNNLINDSASFGAVREAGADGVELDVRIAADGALVVTHDHEYPAFDPTEATADRVVRLIESREMVGKTDQVLTVHPYVSMVDESFMAVATANGLTVNAWTGFDEAPEVVAELAALGVKGVITGYPERAVQSRDRLPGQTKGQLRFFAKSCG